MMTITVAMTTTVTTKTRSMTPGGGGTVPPPLEWTLPTGGTAPAAPPVSFIPSSGCRSLRRTILLTACLWLAALASGAVAPCNAGADSPQAEPTKEDCVAAVEQARSLAAALPSGDISRYFAERDLHQAMVEAGNGEFDDCLEFSARATEEVRELRHTLQPGERLKILQPDE